jgi:hypothetical protein
MSARASRVPAAQFSLALVGGPALDPCVRARSINDGAEMVNGVADRVRAELLGDVRLSDLLRPSST